MLTVQKLQKYMSSHHKYLKIIDVLLIKISGEFAWLVDVPFSGIIFTLGFEKRCVVKTFQFSINTRSMSFFKMLHNQNQSLYIQIL